MSAFRKRFIIVNFAFVLAFLVGIISLFVWGIRGQMNESVTGMGQIIPQGEIQRVMASDIGYVANLPVTRSQAVKKGQLLIELDPQKTNIDKESLVQELAQLQDEARALDAAASSSSSSQMLSSSAAPMYQAWLSASQQAYDANLDSAGMKIQESQHMYQQAMERLNNTEILLNSKKQVLSQYQQLLKDGGVSRNDVAKYEQDVIDLQGQYVALQEEVKARQQEVEQSKQQPRSISGEYLKDILNRRTTLQARIVELERSLNQEKYSLRRQQIYAPFDGVINELNVRGPGETVQPTQVLMTLVPNTAPLLAEVKVPTKNFSYLHVNQRSVLQLDALPYQVYGRLSGTVISISPSTTADEKGQVFYVVRIRPDRLTLRSRVSGRDLPIVSGMTLTADVITRQRNLLSFFLEPIEDRIYRAFRDPVY